MVNISALRGHRASCDQVEKIVVLLHRNGVHRTINLVVVLALQLPGVVRVLLCDVIAHQCGVVVRDHLFTLTVGVAGHVVATTTVHQPGFHDHNSITDAAQLVSVVEIVHQDVDLIDRVHLPVRSEVDAQEAEPVHALTRAGTETFQAYKVEL
jgi:hypothetical protein